MAKKWTYKALEDFGRIRLSDNFYMREFLHSEIAQIHGLLNAPENPDLAIRVGSKLCTEVLEPISEAWGKVHIRSGYRSSDVNFIGNAKKLNCAKNSVNAAAHIWDKLDEMGCGGATACIVIPRYQEYFEKTGDWVSLAWWIHTNIPDYFEMCFFKLQNAFNIRWYEASDIGKSIKTFAVNPYTGDKKNLITSGVVSEAYDAKRIKKCVLEADRIRSGSKIGSR